jgi:hypothetical protein
VGHIIDDAQKLLEGFQYWEINFVGRNANLICCPSYCYSSGTIKCGEGVDWEKSLIVSWRLSNNMEQSVTCV